MNFPFLLKNKAEFDVVGFGTNSVDHLIRVPEYPQFTSKVELLSHTLLPGGEVATTLVGLQRLGLSTSYAGRFGGDSEGAISRRALERENVDLRSSQMLSDAANQIAYILIDERTGERTVVWHRDNTLAYSAEEAPAEIAGSGKILHMTLHDAAACVRMAKAAHASGTAVSVDADRVFEGIEELLPLVHILIASSEFITCFAESSDLESGLTQIQDRFGCAVVGATLGGAGSITYCGGRYIRTPGYEVPGGCVDTTGAGDAYRTGFLFGVLTGESVENSAKIANAVAALKCRGLGAQAALPTRSELIEFRS
jgi:sulfofructose kinase